MKYSQRLHGALILAGFALLLAVIGYAYCQIDPVVADVEKEPFIVPLMLNPGDDWLVIRTVKVDTLPSAFKHPTIMFTDTLNIEALRLSPNGDIFWRGRLVTTDSMLVQGLRDIIEGRR